MAIVEILSANYIQDQDVILVHAIVEDAVCTRHQTMEDPPEYGPAECCSLVWPNEIDETCKINFSRLSGSDLKSLIENNSSINFNWEVCSNG